MKHGIRSLALLSGFVVAVGCGSPPQREAAGQAPASEPAPAPAPAPVPAAAPAAAATGAPAAPGVASPAVPGAVDWELGVVTPTGYVEAAAGPEAPVLLDVRTLEEYQSGHVKGAVHIPHDELQSRLSELDEASRGRGIVVTCESGRRAALAQDILKAAGYQKVAQLKGNMQRWRTQELPLETGPAGP